MKATNSLDGLGILIVFVVSIFLVFVLQSYNNYIEPATFASANYYVIQNINTFAHYIVLK